MSQKSLQRVSLFNFERIVYCKEFAGSLSQVGVDCGEVPPVPIPNTEVKLVRVENTWLATAREDR